MRVTGSIHSHDNTPQRHVKIRLKVAEQELASFKSDKYGRFEYADDKDYAGKTLLCQVGEGYESKEEFFQILSENLDVNIVFGKEPSQPISGEPPPNLLPNWIEWIRQNAGVLASAVLVGILVMLMLVRIMFSDSSENSGTEPSPESTDKVAEWHDLGAQSVMSERGSQVTLVIDQKSDTPYIGFLEGTNDPQLSIMRYAGDKWETVDRRKVTPKNISQIALAVEKDCVYVAFPDPGRGNRVSVIKTGCVEEEFLGARGFSDSLVSDDISLVIYKGSPIIAYKQLKSPRGSFVRRYKSTTKTWEAFWAPLSPPAEVGFTRLTLNENGSLFLALTQGDEQRLVLYSLNHDTWVPLIQDLETAAKVSKRMGSPAFAFSVTKAIPTIVLHDKSNKNKLAAMQLMDQDWQPLEKQQGISMGTASYLSASGLYMVFHDEGMNGQARLMKRTGKEWKAACTTFSEEKAHGLSLAVDSLGTPYVAFQDNNMGGKIRVRICSKQ